MPSRKGNMQLTGVDDDPRARCFKLLFWVELVPGNASGIRPRSDLLVGRLLTAIRLGVGPTEARVPRLPVESDMP